MTQNFFPTDIAPSGMPGDTVNDKYAAAFPPLVPAPTGSSTPSPAVPAASNAPTPVAPQQLPPSPQAPPVASAGKNPPPARAKPKQVGPGDLASQSEEILRNPGKVAENLANQGLAPDNQGGFRQVGKPTNDQEKQQLKGSWEQFFANPQVQSALFAFGTTLLAGPRPGERTGSVIARGLERGATAATKSEDRQLAKTAAGRKEAREEREQTRKETETQQLGAFQRGSVAAKGRENQINAAKALLQNEQKKVENRINAGKLTEQQKQTEIDRFSALTKFAATEKDILGNAIGIDKELWDLGSDLIKDPSQVPILNALDTETDEKVLEKDADPTFHKEAMKRWGRAWEIRVKKAQKRQEGL